MNANINQQPVKPTKAEWDEILDELYGKDDKREMYWQ